MGFGEGRKGRRESKVNGRYDRAEGRWEGKRSGIENHMEQKTLWRLERKVEGWGGDEKRGNV